MTRMRRMEVDWLSDKSEKESKEYFLPQYFWSAGIEAEEDKK